MKRFAFRLERLLELRAWNEKKTELVLAEKAGTCSLLTSRIEENLGDRARASRDAYAPGREITDFRAAEFYLRRLDVERQRLTAELAVAEAEREKARLEWVAKHREKESVGKLKERREAEYYRLALREEAKVLDDMARHPSRSGPLATASASKVAAADSAVGRTEGQNATQGVVTTWRD